MLMLDSHFRPLLTPLTTDAVAIAVTMPIMATVHQLLTVIQPRYSSPAAIWVIPNPSEVATPNRVPTTATTSTA